MMNQFVLPIGDWSKDGHNESENFTVNVNKTKEELIKAYYQSTKRLNMTFDTNDMRKSYPIRLLNGWADNIITAEEVRKLQEGGVDMSTFEDAEISEDGDYEYCSPRDAAILFMEFIKSSLPDMEYEFAYDQTNYLFGHGGDLNISVGYGCF